MARPRLFAHPPALRPRRPFACPSATSIGLVGALVLLGTGAPAHTAELVAERITAENYATHHVGGPDADAGIGDWFLANGTICAAISDPAHESPMTPRGGVLIDLGNCGARDDQWNVLQPMLNLSQSHVVPVDEVEAGRGTERAWIRTRAVFQGIELVTTYSVDLEQPFVLEVTARARRIAEGDALFSIGQILLHPSGQTPVFSASRRHPERSVGFRYPETDRRSITSLLDALITSDLTVLVGADGMPPISYGVEHVGARVEDGDESVALGSFSVSGEHFTFVNSMTEPPWIGRTDEAPGLLQLAQIPFMDIEGDRVVALDYRIHVGDRADVAVISDRLWSDGARVTGRIDDPAARIHIDRESGAPMTQIRPDADGAFSMRLPPGRYHARALAPADRQASQTFEVVDRETDVELPPIRVGPPAWVDLPQGFVGRLTFLPADGGPPVVFGSNRLGQTMGDVPIPSSARAPWLNLAASPVDPDRVPVPPGRYRVVAVRGPEYAAAEIEFEAVAGEERTLTLAPLARVALTPGWIATDYHVHSGESFDSGLPQPQQVIAFAASGAELLVATEHDRVFDPRPAIAVAGLERQLISITGVEVTSAFEGGDSPHSSGHLNAFPIVARPKAYRGGAPSLEGRRLRDALADIRAMPGAPFVQMNHPRPGPDEQEGDTYFSHLGVAGEPFDPTRPLTEPPNSVLIESSPVHGGTDLDYEGVELFNGENLVRYRRVRADWLSLLLQGERIIGTANSDSHRLGTIVGLPRTYVFQPDDRLDAFDEADHMSALRSGRAWGTTGPLVRVKLGEAELGELHIGSTGTLEIAVDAAPWVPVGEWRAYVNGELVHRAAIGAGERASLPLAFAVDAFVTVEVEGPAERLYAEALPGFTPFAFTNPIFVDADGNGRFDAPGLPDDLPRPISDPDRPDRDAIELAPRPGHKEPR